MTEEIINEIYLLAVKSKLQRGAISVDDRLDFIINELNLHSDGCFSQVAISSEQSSQTSLNEALSVVQPNQSQQGVQSSQERKVDNLEIVDHKYSEQPEDEGFLNRDLETSKDTKHIYDIQLTNDPTIAYFELITDTNRSAEYLRYPSMVPPYVVFFENESSSTNSQLVKVERGVLKRSGKIWKIEKPCHMKWC